MDKDQLLSIIERIENVNEQIASLNADKKEIMSEAKSAGFVPKAIKYILKQRQKDIDERQEEKEIFKLYEKTIGL